MSRIEVLHMKALTALLMVLLLALGCTGCGTNAYYLHQDDIQYNYNNVSAGNSFFWLTESVTLDNGKTYTYYSSDDAANDSYSTGDIRWSELSRQEIQDILDLHTEDIPDHDFGPITTARQAVKCGAAVLDEVYERWTETDNVGVYHSQKANIWLVHGMYHDRLSDYTGLGYVVLDADTGEILGTAYETAGSFA